LINPTSGNLMPLTLVRHRFSVDENAALSGIKLAVADLL